MREPDQSSDAVESFRRLLLILDGNLRYLQAVEVDARIVFAYKRLLRYLRSQPSERIAELVGTPPKTHRREVLPRLALTDDEIRAVTPDHVMKLTADPNVPRRELERLAAVRFGVTKGGLSNLRSRKALVEKLLTMVSNEGAHESIARVVDSGSFHTKI
jgi:hypothetical protein